MVLAGKCTIQLTVPNRKLTHIQGFFEDNIVVDVRAEAGQLESPVARPELQTAGYVRHHLHRCLQSSPAAPLPHLGVGGGGEGGPGRGPGHLPQLAQLQVVRPEVVAPLSKTM